MQLIQATENLYSEHFTDGERRRAMRELRIEQKPVGRWLLFRLGVWFGLLFPCLYGVISLLITYPWFDGLLGTTPDE